jgi:hypothetical protein
MTQNIITAGDASNPIAIQGGNDGTLVLQSGLAGAKVNALSFAADGTPTFLKGPVNVVAFSAYQNANQTGLASGAVIKCNLNQKEFDTTNAFDSTINYRFTPLISGYYQINGSTYLTGSLTGAQTNIYKNGVLYKAGNGNTLTTGAFVGQTSCIVYMNGSTDYIELFAYATVSAGTWVIQQNQPLTWLQGTLIAKA